MIHETGLTIEDPSTYAINMAQSEIDNLKTLEYKTEYTQLLSFGMFFEFYPELTGEWEKDKKEFALQIKKLRCGNH